MNRTIALLSLLFIAAVPARGQDIGAQYLIITNDAFYNDILPLARWKHKKGLITRIAKLSETGSSAPEIRNYIVNAYNNWPVRPAFILLVGAPNYLPMEFYSGAYTDNYYTDMGGDLLNEILSGRLTVHSSSEAQNVVNKIMLYERYPDTTDYTWFGKATLIANLDGEWSSDSIYWENVHYYASLMSHNGFTRIDTLSNSYGHNYQDVINAVNQGRGYVLYRGSGVSNWYYPFDCNPDQADNGRKLPIVLSITCATLGTGSTPCAAERWFLTGTALDPRGAAGYFATTTVLVNGAHFRSAVAHGFADAVFVENRRTFGEACESGRKRVWSLYGNANEYLGYHTVGDPEMNLWAYPPQHRQVIHPAVASLGYNDLPVTVLVNGSPRPDIVVCAMQRDTVIWSVDTTDAGGQARLTFNVTNLDTIYLTATGHTMNPYEGYIFVSPSGSYVGYYKHEIDDSLNGNHNHRVNPGETVSLPVWVKNFGADSARDISGILRCEDPEVILTDSLASFPDLGPGDSARSTPPFRFQADSGLEDGHQINFLMSSRTATDTVPSAFHVAVTDARLAFVRDSVIGENGNGILDPGETADFTVSLRNRGHETSDSGRAILRVTGPYVTIADSLGSYPPIDPADTANNLSDRFVVAAGDSTPIGTIANFSLVIASHLRADTFNFSLVVGKLNYLIWNPDPTPGPGQVMDVILSQLGYVGDYATALPADINRYQCVFACAGVFPNNYVIGSGSPEAAALVNYLGLGGRIYLEGGDVWAYDPLMGGYDFSSLFNINAYSDGMSDMGPVNGLPGTFTRDMSFLYGGENEFMDRITSAGQSAVIFHDTDDNYDCGVAYDAGPYRTVGTSFELGSLIDGSGVSTRSALMDSILRFFGVQHGIAEEAAAPLRSADYLSVFPNPFRNHVTISYNIGTGAKRIELKIYDVSGRLVRSASLPQANSSGPYSLIWSGEDEHGRKVGAGVYFVKLLADGIDRTYKVILVR
jgi:hypothetical protein